MTAPTNTNESVREKIEKWLAKEGYPLEFSVANTFRSASFDILQGEYVRGDKEEPAREIDVAATISTDVDHSLLRIYHLVECKWSKDKPWVVFLGKRSMASSALITQTVGSKTARALLWTRAGDPVLHALSTFAAPHNPGFGGRQVFGEKHDVFYATLQSVMDKAALLAESYDEARKTLKEAVAVAVVVFPVVVIEGQLYTATFDENVMKLVLEEVTQVRMHWRGAAAWRLHATIDIVTTSGLPAFAEQRYKDSVTMAKQLTTSLHQLHSCLTRRSLSPLEITQGSRGVIGLPYLLREMTMQFKTEKRKTMHKITD